MNIFKWWITGIIVIVVLFLSFAPPSEWFIYLDEIIHTPLLITVQQSAFLVLGGAILGSSMMLIKEVLFK